MNQDQIKNEEVIRSVKLPIALLCMSMAVATILGAGASFVKMAMPALVNGEYLIVTGALLGLIAATIGTPVMVKKVNDWLISLVAKLLQQYC